MQRVIRRFVHQVMRGLRGVFVEEVPDIAAQLRGYLSDIDGDIHRGEPETEETILGTGWTLENSMVLGLQDMMVMHRFLWDVVDPPRGGTGTGGPSSDC